MFQHHVPASYSSITFQHHVPTSCSTVTFQHHIPPSSSNITFQHHIRASRSTITTLFVTFGEGKVTAVPRRTLPPSQSSCCACVQVVLLRSQSHSVAECQFGPQSASDLLHLPGLHRAAALLLRPQVSVLPRQLVPQRVCAGAVTGFIFHRHTLRSFWIFLHSFLLFCCSKYVNVPSLRSRKVVFFLLHSCLLLIWNADISRYRPTVSRASLCVYCVSQRQAHSAGLFFFRCTLCSNKENFQEEMLRMGIFIPER